MESPVSDATRSRRIQLNARKNLTHSKNTRTAIIIIIITRIIIIITRSSAFYYFCDDNNNYYNLLSFFQKSLFDFKTMQFYASNTQFIFYKTFLKLKQLQPNAIAVIDLFECEGLRRDVLPLVTIIL